MAENMNENNESWGELSREEIDQIFQEALDNVSRLHDTLIIVNEDVGYAHQYLSALYPRTMSLYDKAEEDSSIYPVVFSGVKYVQAIGTQFKNYDEQAKGIQVLISGYANSTGTVSSSTDAAVYLYNVKLPDNIPQIPKPPSRKSRDEYIEKLKELDPPLGKTYEEIWQIYFGTTADKCRASLFMIRQVFDHLFGILAPDSQVRESKYWTEKEGDKPMQIYRSERIQFAANNNVKDAGLAEALSSSSKHLLEFYDAVNRAHDRGLLDESKAEKALHAMNQSLMDWIDAI